MVSHNISVIYKTSFFGYVNISQELFYNVFLDVNFNLQIIWKL